MLRCEDENIHGVLDGVVAQFSEYYFGGSDEAGRSEPVRLHSLHRGFDDVEISISRDIVDRAQKRVEYVRRFWNADGLGIALQ